jgi:hypothetical protein
MKDAREAGQAIRERFKAAQESLIFWQNQYERGPGIDGAIPTGAVDDLITAAQAWGVMAGLAAAAGEIGINDLPATLDSIEPNLFPRDYKTGQEAQETGKTTERALTIRIIYSDELPGTVHGASAKTGPGAYMILLNGRDPKERQEAAAGHEWGHIYRGDHDRKGSASSIEASAHKEGRAE